MRSLHINDFNHDEWASEYDKDVLDENNPIRAGYKKVLTWVIQNAEINIDKSIEELQALGFLTEVEKFSELSYGIKAMK